MGVTDRYYVDASSDELVILEQVLCAIGSGHLWCQILGGQTPPLSAIRRILRAGTRKDCWIVLLLMSNVVCKKSASTVFGTLDTFLMPEFVITRQKVAKHCNLMQFRQFLRKVSEKGDLSLPGQLDVISNIIGVWLFIVSYLKRLGRKTAATVLWYGFFFYFYSSHNGQCLFAFSCLEKKNRWILLHWPAEQNEFSLVPSDPWNVLVLASNAMIM